MEAMYSAMYRRLIAVKSSGTTGSQQTEVVTTQSASEAQARISARVGGGESLSVQPTEMRTAARERANGILSMERYFSRPMPTRFAPNPH
jgi:hypothetical protein